MGLPRESDMMLAKLYQFCTAATKEFSQAQGTPRPTLVRPDGFGSGNQMAGVVVEKSAADNEKNSYESRPQTVNKIPLTKPNTEGTKQRLSRMSCLPANG